MTPERYLQAGDIYIARQIGRFNGRQYTSSERIEGWTLRACTLQEKPWTSRDRTLQEKSWPPPESLYRLLSVWMVLGRSARDARLCCQPYANCFERHLL